MAAEWLAVRVVRFDMGGSAGGMAGDDAGNSDGGVSMDSGGADRCGVWPVNAPPPGVAVEAICASTDTPVSSPDFCYPLVNSQNDANTLFAVGIYCGRGLWQVSSPPIVTVVSGAATVGPVMVPTNGTAGATGVTLTLENPPQDGDTVTVEVDSTVQCADGPRTIVTIMILAYCAGEQLWVGGSVSSSCNECPLRMALPI